MSVKRHKVSKYQGVYYRDLNKNFNGKPDRCYDISYVHLGRLIWEKVGKSSEGYTADKAAVVRSERIQAIRHGQELPKKMKAVRLADIWEDYLEYLQGNAEPLSVAVYTTLFKRLKPILGNKLLSEITPQMVEKLKGDFRQQEFSDSTIKSSIILLKSLFKRAIIQKKFPGPSPLATIKVPNTRSSARERFLTKEEADALLVEARKENEELYGACLFSLETGMREAEIMNLTHERIDLEHGLIYIMDTKNDKNRTAYITPRIQKFLQENKGHGPVFQSSINAMYERFVRIVKRLGFNKGVEDRRFKVVFHSLRHTFASWLALNGISLQVIMELLGHSSIEMTLRYAKLIPDYKKAAVDKLFNQSEQCAA